MLIRSIALLTLIAILLTGCVAASPSTSPAPIPTHTPTLEFSQPTPASLVSPTSEHPPSPVVSPATVSSNQQFVLNQAFNVINALKDKDMFRLSQFVHPQYGLRFSPYSYVLDSHQVFQADKVAGLMDDSMTYLWGNYDGTGEPINLTFADYYNKFVFDEDFTNAPQISLDHRLGTGNTLDNAQEYYPGAMIVEFYFPGFDPQYNGMDWRSLKLVFMQSDQAYYLAGIIHDQWTT